LATDQSLPTLLGADPNAGRFFGNEPNIAVNPLNAANVVVAHVNALAISQDGGSTFTITVTATVPAGFGNCGDDALAFDGNGHLYWSYLDCSNTTSAVEVNVQQVNPTTGAFVGGAFNVSNSTTQPDDKEWIAVDSNPSSPFAGNIYVVWSRLNAQSRIEFSRSTTTAGTGAINGFSAPQVISTENNFVWPSHVAVAQNGDVYVAYHDNTCGSNTTTDQHIQVIRSTNGGADLAAGMVNQKSSFNAGVTCNVQTSPASTNQVPFVNSWMQGANAPYILPDPVRPGNVYIVYNSDPDGNFTAGDPGDVFLARSTDNGNTWSSFVPVSHGPANTLQAFPTGAIDKLGNIAVFWYDTRGNQIIDPDGVIGDKSAFGGVTDDHYAMNLFANSSSDGGVTFSANDFQVNDNNNPFDPNAGAPIRFGNRPPPNNNTANTLRIGEYNGIALVNGIAYVDWTGNTPDPPRTTAVGQQIFYKNFPVALPAGIHLTGSVLSICGDLDFPNENDTIRLVRDPANHALLDVFINNTTAVPTFSMPLGLVSQINVFTGGGNDNLIVDSSNGLINVANGIDYAADTECPFGGSPPSGDTGFDTLTLTQTGGAAQFSDNYTGGFNSTTQEGQSVIVGPSGTQTVNFNGLEPTIDIVPATRLTVNGTIESDAINYNVGPNSGTALVGFATTGQVSISDAESIEFANKDNLLINGLAGSDEINLNNPTVPSGSAPGTFLTAIFVDGGDPTASDRLILNGTTAQDTINISPLSPDSGTVAIAGLPTVGFTTIESLVINGQGGNDNLKVATPVGVNRVTYTVGPAPDSAFVQVDNLVPLTFTNLGLAGSATLADPSGLPTDTLVYNGAAGNDLFTVTSTTVTLSVNQQFTVNGPGIRDLALNGAPGLPDVLIVQAPGATQFVVLNKGTAANSGSVLMFTAAVQDRAIAFSNVAFVSPQTFVDASGNPNLLVMGPDTNEPNDFQANATFLGSGSTLQVQHATIFPSANTFPGVPADQDYYRVVAQETGTLDFQVYFKVFPTTLLPGGGNLALDVRDNAGNIVAQTATPAMFGATGATGNARIRIAVIAGQNYTLHVFGALADGTPNPAVINGYDVTIINTPPPTPFNLELSRSVPPGIPGNPDTGDLPPNAPPDDSGRSQFDNVTNVSTPRIYIRLSDGIFLNDLPGNGTPNSPPAGVIPIPFSTSATTTGFRLAVFDGNNTQTPVGFAIPVDPVAFPGLYQFDFTTPLADGLHHLTAAVQMVDPAIPNQTGFGPVSTSLDIIVDTALPPVFFGAPTDPTHDGLDQNSDSGVSCLPATFGDRITNVTTPTFFGTAEANSIIRVYVDSNGTGIFDPATDLQLGSTVATPTDGTNADPNGQWSLQSAINLNDSSLLPLLPFDGVRRIFVTAEDLAGNVNAPQQLDIFLDTQGPQITNVQINSFPNFNLFGLKPNNFAQGPTPLVNALNINLQDLPAVDAEFFRDAIAAGTGCAANSPGTYLVQGDNTGIVTIAAINVTNNVPVVGQAPTAVITLLFASPLPDDRYTLTIHDGITDLAGNKLDGESNAAEPSGTPTFPSGDGAPGGDFVARFTVNSRPHIGTSFCGSQYIDINGNGVFDPVNKNNDQTNADKVFHFGLSTDAIFAGNFTPTGVPANGFSKLGAYGFTNGVYRWLLNFDGTGVANYGAVSGLQINGLPVAGHFNPGLTGDQIALFDGHGNWFIDFAGNNNIGGPGTIVVSDGLSGFPIVGDFDGSGSIDLATYRPDLKTFFFDLNPLGGGPRVLTSLNFGFPGVSGRPVAADMNHDGITDIGLFEPGRQGNEPADTAEWYFLVSSGTAVPGTINTLAHPFSPTPLGSDLFFQFGHNQDCPLVGLFDPPVGPAAPPPVTIDYIASLYHDVLQRTPTSTELQVWAQPLASGITRSQVASILINSPEHRAQVITEDYTKYLGRAPEPAAISAWQGFLAMGGRDEDMLAGILSSPEYFLRHGGTIDGFVGGLYQDLFSRTAMPSELAAWRPVAATSWTAVVRAFAGSWEFKASQVNQYYQDFLGRPADAGSLNAWTGALVAGFTQEQVEIALAGSEEYFENHLRPRHK
jgi:hypothetical protein